MGGQTYADGKREKDMPDADIGVQKEIKKVCVRQYLIIC